MKNVSISSTFPENKEPAYLLMGFENPKIAVPLFVKAAPLLIMGNLGWARKCYICNKKEDLKHLV